MVRITLVFRTRRNAGALRLRFRLRQGRDVQLYYKSRIEVDIGRLEALMEKLDANLEVKKRVRNWDVELHDLLLSQKTLLKEAFHRLEESHLPLTSEYLEREMDRHRKTSNAPPVTWLTMFLDITHNQYADGVIGYSRYKHSLVIYRVLLRFLTIKSMNDIPPDQVTPELIMEFRNFLFDEYKYVNQYKELYFGVSTYNLPKKRRGNNTVVTALNRLQAFFTELEDKDLIVKSPFRKLGKERKRVVMKDRYDEPVYLTSEEFQRVLEYRVPPRLEEVKEAFILQCALGCRISDFKALTLKNVSVSSEGIPYVHYLPQKTLNVQRDFKEIQTPLVLFALQIIRKRKFEFPILKNVSGQQGYNRKIKELLEICGIDRLCSVFNEETRQNDYMPLFQLGSSKLCRKTHVDLMTKVQVNKYAAGLHEIGSSAIERYTHLTLKDRFILMSAAFKQKLFNADNDLNPTMI